jgi:hypothetical protein
MVILEDSLVKNLIIVLFNKLLHVVELYFCSLSCGTLGQVFKVQINSYGLHCAKL